MRSEWSGRAGLGDPLISPRGRQKRLAAGEAGETACGVGVIINHILASLSEGERQWGARVVLLAIETRKRFGKRELGATPCAPSDRVARRSPRKGQTSRRSASAPVFFDLTGQPLYTHNKARRPARHLPGSAGNSRLVESMLDNPPVDTTPTCRAVLPRRRNRSWNPWRVPRRGYPASNGAPLSATMDFWHASPTVASEEPRPPSRSVDQVTCGIPLPVGTRLGDFEVTGIVHRGSFGIVYAGEDRPSQRKIAVTEYLPARLAERMADGNVGVRSLRHQQSFRDGKQRFLSEARILAALDEPALVKVLRFWEQHGTAYMAMPLDDGQTLNDVLRDSPKPSEAWLKAIFGPLLDALAALHKSDCYPYDVTPDNIVVLDDGTPLLSAVGAARRIVADATEDLTLDLNPAFAPLEQLAHDPTMPEGPWSDIYAVAAVLHFAITGKPVPAPTARTAADTLPHLRDANGDYSAPFLDAVERGLAVHPGDRPRTIAEFRAALGIRSITPEATSAARPASSPEVPSTVDRTAGLLPESGPIPLAGVPDGTRIYVTGPHRS